MTNFQALAASGVMFQMFDRTQSLCLCLSLSLVAILMFLTYQCLTKQNQQLDEPGMADRYINRQL